MLATFVVDLARHLAPAHAPFRSRLGNRLGNALAYPSMPDKRRYRSLNLLQSLANGCGRSGFRVLLVGRNLRAKESGAARREVDRAIYRGLPYRGLPYRGLP